MMEVSPNGAAEMNYKDLKALGLNEGDAVKITAASGASVQVKVKRSRRALEGSVIVPYHFSDLKLNDFTRWEQPVVKVRVEKA
jgi:formylmethanofuran dehydrogenase subunit D